MICLSLLVLLFYHLTDLVSVDARGGSPALFWCLALGLPMVFFFVVSDFTFRSISSNWYTKTSQTLTGLIITANAPLLSKTKYFVHTLEYLSLVHVVTLCKLLLCMYNKCSS